MKHKSKVKRLISLLLSGILLSQTVPLVEVASAEEKTTKIPEMEVSEDILSSDVFYLPAGNAVLDEDGGTYLLRIARGGDCVSDAGVIVRIADYTAKYGKDYTVSLYEESEKADSPANNQSLLERMEGEDYTESELRTEDEYAEMLEEDEALREQTTQAVQEAIDYIEEESGAVSDEKEEIEETIDAAVTDETAKTVETAETPDSAEADPAATEEETNSERDEQMEENAASSVETEANEADPSDTMTENKNDSLQPEQSEEKKQEPVDLEGSEPTNSDVPEIEEIKAEKYVDPVQAARELYTGIDGDPQRVTSDTNTMQQIQDAADVISRSVVGATLQVDFKAGEREKNIAIHVKDNAKGDGDRYFYFMLSEPYGTTTNSAASSCAFTLVDDEEQTPSQVGFAQEAYTVEAESDTVSVDIIRKGAVNTMASVHLSASPDSAVAARDFSPVDADVVFPIGIDRRTIDIPVCTDCLDSDADFTLTLDEASNCTVSRAESEVTLSAPEKKTMLGSAAEESYRLSDVVTGDALDIKAPVVTGHSDHYDGHNKYYSDDGGRWDLMWADNGNWWDHTFGTSYYGLVSARWELGKGRCADIAGVQAVWDSSGSCAEMSVGFVSDDNRDISWKSYHGKLVYEAKKNFDKGTQNFFSDRLYPAHVVFFNDAYCEDCNHLYLYSLKPIYRPFVLEFDQNYDASLPFLNEDGSYSNWKDASFLAIGGADNDSNNQVVRYTLDGKNSVPFRQTLGGNVITPYVTLDYVDAARNGNTKRFATFGDSLSSTYTTTLTSDWINSSTSYIAFEDNNVAGWENQTSAVGKRGRILLRPHFKYKDVTIELNPADSGIGYAVMSGTPCDISESTDYTYHRGDIIKLQSVVNEKFKGLYEPAGYRISYKHNISDTDYVREDSIITMNLDNGTAAYLDENERLRYGYYEITPLFKKTTNTITVRVKADDVKYFDAGYGLFATNVVENVKVNGVKYRDYTVFNDPIYGKNYALTARFAETAPKNCYQEWQESGNGYKYGGEVFFHEAKGSGEENMITLSVRTEGDNCKDRYATVSGSVFRPTYSMATKDVDYMSMRPAAGAIINFGSVFTTAKEDGSFETAPFRIMSDTADSTGHRVRYIIAINDEELLCEMPLPQVDAKQETISVVEEIVDPDGVKESRVVHKEADVCHQNLGQKSISPENGSIISQIDVFTDTPYAGQVITIAGEGTVSVSAKMRAPVKYTKLVADENGVVTEYPNCDETVTGITFVVYDSRTKQEVKSYEAVLKDGTFTANIELSDVLPSNELYLRVTTDRSHGIYTKGAPDEQINATTYADVYTGYTFIQKSTDSVPVLQRCELPANMSFDTLPLLGDTGMSFNFPFCSIGCMRTATGYRLYIGANVTKVADKIMGTHMTQYAGDTGTYYRSMFSHAHPIDSFIQGLQATYKDAFQNVPEAYEGNTAALGSPTWKVNVQLGVYFEFIYTDVTDPNKGYTDTACIFNGVGGYIGVSAGVCMAWYTILPVVFIPAYFGIDISGQVLGFFGAGTDASKSHITFEDAQHATVKFEDKLGKFQSSVKAAATVQVYVGVGLAGTIGLRGGGEFSAMGLWEPSEIVSDWGAALTFRIGMWVDLFMFTIPLMYSFPSIKYGSIEEYTNLVVDEATVSEGDPMLREPYSDVSSDWTANEKVLQAGFSPVSTKVIEKNAYEHPDVQLLQLSDGSVFMAFLDSDLSRGDSDRTVLKYTVYRDGKWSEPAAVQNDTRGDFQPSACEMTDGKVMLSWLSGDPEKKTTENPENYLAGLEVFTAVVDTKSGTVSELTQLTSDSFYDYTPTSVYDKETGDRAVYFVKTASDGSISQMVNSYANDCVVVYMLYSQEMGRWLFDYYYDAEVDSESSRQTLIENWHGQRFLASPIRQLGLDVPNITDFTAISYNGMAVYAYTIDCDSNNDTATDKELFLQFYDFHTHRTFYPVRITNDTVCDTLPKLVRVGEGESASTKLFWYRNENDIAYLDISSLIHDGVNTDGTIKSEYLVSPTGEQKDLESLYSYVEIKGNAVKGQNAMADFDVTISDDDIYVIWTQPNTITNEDGTKTQSREVYASALIQGDSAAADVPTAASENGSDTSSTGTGNSWSDPYRLTHSEIFTDEPHAVIDDTDHLMVLYNSYQQTLTDNADNPVIISDFHLNAALMEPCGSVEVTNMSLSDSTPMPGDKVEVRMTVKNTGLTAASGYKVSVSAQPESGAASTITEVSSDIPLLPGNEVSYTFTWDVPNKIDGMRLVAKANETGMKNTAVYESEPIACAPYYTVSEPVVYQDSDGCYHLICDVTNVGNSPSQDGDALTVMLTGPYGLGANYSAEEGVFAQISLERIDVGKSMHIDTVLDVIPEAFDVYGFVDCFVAVRDADGKYLSDGEEIRLLAEKPVELLLNGKKFPENITLHVGDTMKFDVSCKPECLSDMLSAAFGTEDTSVAAFDKTTLRAIHPGTTTIYGSVMPYGTLTREITITVLPEPGHVHDWENDFTIDVPATCTADGQKSIHCKTCGASKDITVIPMLGHSWNDGEITRKPTMKEAGEKTYTCTRCGATYTEEVSKLKIFSPITGDEPLYVWQLLAVISLAAALVLLEEKRRKGRKYVKEINAERENIIEEEKLPDEKLKDINGGGIFDNIPRVPENPIDDETKEKL